MNIKIMKDIKAYQENICDNQNISSDHSENDLINIIMGDNNPINRYIRIIVILFKFFLLITFLNLSFRLLGKNHCSIVTILIINDIITAISLFIILIISKYLYMLNSKLKNENT